MASWNRASKRADYDGKWRYEGYWQTDTDAHTSGDRGNKNYKWGDYQPPGQEDVATQWAWDQSREWKEVMQVPDNESGTTLGDRGTSSGHQAERPGNQ